MGDTMLGINIPGDVGGKGPSEGLTRKGYSYYL